MCYKVLGLRDSLFFLSWDGKHSEIDFNITMPAGVVASKVRENREKYKDGVHE